MWIHVIDAALYTAQLSRGHAHLDFWMWWPTSSTVGGGAEYLWWSQLRFQSSSKLSWQGDDVLSVLIVCVLPQLLSKVRHLISRMCEAFSVPIPPVVAELFSLASSAQVSVVTQVSFFWDEGAHTRNLRFLLWRMCVWFSNTCSQTSCTLKGQ